MDKMVWIDLETTGLDPRREEILEIGIKITDLELKPFASFYWLLNPWGDQLAQGLAFCDTFIQQMHTKSGLFEELMDKKPTFNCWDGKIEEHIKGFLELYDAFELPMCGNNVPFDRAFLTQHLPSVAKLFHYRNLDISSLKNAYIIEASRRPDSEEEWWPVWESPESKHRALPDLDISIMEYQFYREHLFR